MSHKATKGIPAFYDEKGELHMLPELETHLLIFPKKHIPDYETLGDTSTAVAHEINEGSYPLDIGPRGPLHPDFSEGIFAPEETDKNFIDEDNPSDGCAAAERFSHQPLDGKQKTLAVIVTACRDNSQKALENPQLCGQNTLLPLCCRQCLNLD